MIPSHLLTATSVPLEPDEETARELLRQELAKNEYASARPTPLDLLLERIWNWIIGVFSQPIEGIPFDITPGALVLVLLTVVLILALLFGRPALNRRRRARADGAPLFFDDDTRTPAELRAASEAAARQHDWALAVMERFRAIARDLGDRTLVTIRPGSTAHGVARHAADAFPSERDALESAASDFDDVRYLDRAGTEAAWTRTRDLDERVRRARPVDAPDLVEADA